MNSTRTTVVRLSTSEFSTLCEVIRLLSGILPEDNEVLIRTDTIARKLAASLANNNVKTVNRISGGSAGLLSWEDVASFIPKTGVVR